MAFGRLMCALRSSLRAALVAMSVAAGCAPQFDGQVFRGDGFAFRLASVPSAWRQVETTDRGLAFRDEENRGTALVNGRCGRDEDVPLKALTQHLFFTFTERHIVREELVPFDDREALHTTLTAKLDGVPMRFDVWVLKRDGCVYDLLYFAPREGFERGVPAFLELVKGFTSKVRDGR